jgi:hypothetical protein
MRKFSGGSWKTVCAEKKNPLTICKKTVPAWYRVARGPKTHWKINLFAEKEKWWVAKFIKKNPYKGTPIGTPAPGWPFERRAMGWLGKRGTKI